MEKVFAFIFSAFLLTQCHNIVGKPETISGFAPVNGTTLYYEMAGQGETVVFIHGNFGDRRHWDRQFKPLSKKFKVVRYDVRGFGKSAMPKTDEPYSDWDDLKALMD